MDVGTAASTTVAQKILPTGGCVRKECPTKKADAQTLLSQPRFGEVSGLMRNTEVNHFMLQI
jgi:hypothetical protein